MKTDNAEAFAQRYTIAEQLVLLHLGKEMPGECPELRQVGSCPTQDRSERYFRNVKFLFDMGKIPETRIIWQKAIELQQMNETEQVRAFYEYAQSLDTRG